LPIFYAINLAPLIGVSALMIVRPAQEQFALDGGGFSHKKKRREFFGHAAAIQLKYARDNGKSGELLKRLFVLVMRNLFIKRRGHTQLAMPSSWRF
jgi:hypothetical protein